MTKRILIFEDTLEQQATLVAELTKAGCEVLAISHSHAEKEADRIRSFKPDAAVVDSIFPEGTWEGVRILNYLDKQFPNMPTVVCTCLLNEDETRERAHRTYSRAPGVRAVLAKQLLRGEWCLPSGNEILTAFDLCADSRD